MHSAPLASNLADHQTQPARAAAKNQIPIATLFGSGDMDNGTAYFAETFPSWVPIGVGALGGSHYGYLGRELIYDKALLNKQCPRCNQLRIIGGRREFQLVPNKLRAVDSRIVGHGEGGSEMYN